MISEPCKSAERERERERVLVRAVEFPGWRLEDMRSVFGDWNGQPQVYRVKTRNLV